MIGGLGGDFTHPNGVQLPPTSTIPRWWPSVAASVTESRTEDATTVDQGAASLFSFLTFGVEDDRTKAVDERDVIPSYLRFDDVEEFSPGAASLSRKCIVDCRVDEVLVNDSRFLSHDAFACLLQALHSAVMQVSEYTIPSPSDKTNFGFDSSSIQPGIRGSFSHDDAMSFGYNPVGLSEADDLKARQSVSSFCIDILCELTIRNRDRLTLVWPATHDLIIKTLAPATQPSPVLERAIIGLLRIAMRFIHRDEIRGDLLRTLSLLVKLPLSVTASLGTPLASCIYHIAKTNTQNICTTSGWHTLMSILESCARFPEPAPTIGFAALQFLITQDQSVPVLNPETFAVFLDALYLYASTVLPCSKSACDLLYSLTGRVPSMCSAEKSDTQDDSSRKEWLEYWSPILLAFSQLCRDERGDVRNHAFGLMESVVRSGGPAENLTIFEKQMVLNTVLLPLARDIFDPDGVLASRSSLRRRLKSEGDSDHSPEDGTRLMAMSIVSRFFLQNQKLFVKHLSIEDTQELWIGVLLSFRNALALDSGADEALKDRFLEMMKNNVLVAGSEGVFRVDVEPGWTKTQSLTKHFIPDLRAVISETL